jgi:heme/copper-type cytochrome/quinol oxidase subunit 4
MPKQPAAFAVTGAEVLAAALLLLLLLCVLVHLVRLLLFLAMHTRQDSAA